MRAKYSRRVKGFSLIELLIVVAIMMVLAAIALPFMSQALMFTKESAAAKQIGTVHTVQMQYYAQFGRYAAQLSKLGPPTSGQPGPAGARLISAEFALGKRSGYIFQIQSSPTGYTVTAVPEVFNRTGRRTFYSDETGVIRENWDAEPATENSKEFH